MEKYISVIDIYLNRKSKTKKHSNKKITREEYINKLAIVNPNIELIGELYNMGTKTMHHCLKHDVYWETLPSTMLKGSGCKKCCGEKISKKLTKSKDEFLHQLSQINTEIQLVGEYIDTRTLTSFYCSKHDYTWETTPDSVLHGHYCKYCGYKKNALSRTKTQEQYEKDVAKINPNIKVIGKYINNNIEILHQCLIDNYIWNVKPANILSGKGCPMCSGHITLTHDEYVDKLFQCNPKLEVIDEYVNASTPILHRCRIHDIIFKPYPYTVLKGSGCYYCGIEKQTQTSRKTHEQYVEDLFKINPDIEVIGEYINSSTPILHQCKLDGYQWLAKPANILIGKGCPMCNETNGERQIRQWCEANNIEYIFQKRFDDCRDNKPLPFDFYLPKQNTCIEYDGLQHFQSIEYFGGEEHFKMCQRHDKIKNEYCQNNNIELIRITYKDNINDTLNNYLIA